MLTPRMLGTCRCVLLLQVLCRMKKLIGGVKRAFTSSPSSWGSGSRSGDGSQNSARSSSFMPHHTRPGYRSAILDMMTFLWPWMMMTFPSVAPRRWRSMSLSTSESLVTLYIWCELAREDWNGRRASPHPLDYWLGKTLRRGSDDSSNGLITLQPCKWNCKHPLIARMDCFQ
jgi:hypothetical protein